MSEGVEHLLAVQKSSRNCKQKKSHHVINKTTVLTNMIKHECACVCSCGPSMWHALFTQSQWFVLPQMMVGLQ